MAALRASQAIALSRITWPFRPVVNYAERLSSTVILQHFHIYSTGEHNLPYIYAEAVVVETGWVI